MSSALYGGGGDSNPLSGRNVRGRVFGEEVEQLDEIAPLLALGAKAIGSGLVRKAAGNVAKNVAGEALGKMFKKSKNPGEESTE